MHRFCPSTRFLFMHFLLPTVTPSVIFVAAWLMVSGSQTNSRLLQGSMSMAAWTRGSGSSGTGSNSSAGILAPPYQDIISQGNPNKSLSCPRCDRKYAVLYTLERHLRYECGVEKQFSCGICFKRFKRSDVLKVHQRNAGHVTEEDL